MKLHTVHLRINDAATGAATPVRLRVTGPDGRYYPPLGRLRKFAAGINEDVGGNLQLGDRQFCYIDGACEIELPAGCIHIEASKGPEYRPLSKDVDIKPGQLSVRLSIERLVDLRGANWISGDCRAHFIAPHAALLEAAGEDLAVVNVLACEWHGKTRSIPNLLAFSGQAPALQQPGHGVVVNTLNTSPLGRLALLNCHRVVYPLHLEEIDWALSDWCDQCHRKGGLVIWPDGDEGPSEAIADLILGKIDAIEVTDLSRPIRPEWYALLDCGFRVPLVGSSGKESNATALGAVRTYACVPNDESSSYKAWIEAVRAGRTFVTNGPLLFFTINDQLPGSEVHVKKGELVRIHAEAGSLTPLERVEIIANGEVMMEVTGLQPDFEMPIRESRWWAARCTSASGTAHTSSIYVRVGEQPIWPRPSSLERVRDHLGRFELLVIALAKQNRFASERDWQRLQDVIRAAGDRLESCAREHLKDQERD